jgi:hypothetical protein
MSVVFASEDGFHEREAHNGPAWHMEPEGSPQFRIHDWNGDGIVDASLMTSHGKSPINDGVCLRAGSDTDGELDVWPESVNAPDVSCMGLSRNPEIESSNFHFGHADADGHTDLMISVGETDRYDPILGGLSDEGHTYIIHGPLGSIPHGVDAIDRATTRIFGSDGEELGRSSAFVDVNGDGLDDPALGSYHEASYLFYGPLPSGTIGTADSNATWRDTIDWYSVGLVIPIGDLNNDGRQDLIFTGDGQDRAFLFYGQPTE